MSEYWCAWWVVGCWLWVVGCWCRRMRTAEKRSKFNNHQSTINCGRVAGLTVGLWCVSVSACGGGVVLRSLGRPRLLSDARRRTVSPCIRDRDASTLLVESRTETLIFTHGTFSRKNQTEAHTQLHTLGTVHCNCWSARATIIVHAIGGRGIIGTI